MPIASSHPITEPAWSGGRTRGGTVILANGLRQVELHEGSNNIYTYEGGEQVGRVYAYSPNNEHNTTGEWLEYWVAYDIGQLETLIHQGQLYAEHVSSGVSEWDTIRSALAQAEPAGKDWKYFSVQYNYEDPQQNSASGTGFYGIELRDTDDNLVGKMIHKHIGGNKVEHWMLKADFDGAAFSMESAGQQNATWLTTNINPSQYVNATWSAINDI